MTLPTLLLCVVVQADGNGWPATAVDEYIAGRRTDARARPGTRDTMRCRHVAFCDEHECNLVDGLGEDLVNAGGGGDAHLGGRDLAILHQDDRGPGRLS